MSIRSHQLSYSAGETKSFIGGGFFTIEQVTDEVELTIKDPHGNVVGEIENIGAGFWINLEDKNIGSIDVISATAQTINIIIGSGEFGVNKTTTVIGGGTLDPETLVTQSDSLTTTTVDTIITPATNINGVKIHNINMKVNNNAGVTTVLSKTSAPVTYYDASARSLFYCYFNSTVYMAIIDKANFPIIVPAGEGIYTFATVVDNARVSIDYEIL